MNLCENFALTNVTLTKFILHSKHGNVAATSATFMFSQFANDNPNTLIPCVGLEEIKEEMRGDENKEKMVRTGLKERKIKEICLK